MLYANRFTGKTSEMILRLKAEKGSYLDTGRLENVDS
jgi:hypothetical protein